MKRSLICIGLLCGFTPLLAPLCVRASGGSGGGGSSNVDKIKVSKCYYDAPTGEGLIKAASSDPNAQLTAFLPSGAYYGNVQNGGGGIYGGTGMGYQASNPTYVTIKSSSGGSITVPTTPFQP